jgi:hypothetical protein
MSITPKGMSIQEAYKNYRENKLIVNRKYQRKLVWDIKEKKSLIDSIQKDYPIPLMLLAQGKNGELEIIDGMQRLNAIFSYIENSFSDENGHFFNVDEFTRAKQVAQTGVFEKCSEGEQLLDPSKCANFLDYQLAVTIFPSDNQDVITDVFGRINSGGRQLSRQEKRQAGMLDVFSSIVRKLASEIRGDASKEIVNLVNMPEVSIDTMRSDLKYRIKAENTFWIEQGVINSRQLKESEDEEILADIVASILLEKPIAKSAELLDNIYDPSEEIHQKILNAIARHGEQKISEEVKTIFSVLRNIIDQSSTTQKALRNKVNPNSSNAIKDAFFSICLALHNLIIKKEMAPCEQSKIFEAFSGLQQKLTKSANHAKVDDRQKNIDLVVGLIQNYFVKSEPSMLGHGAGLIIDLENSLRRSKIETSQYECKQGILNLDKHRRLNEGLLDKVLETLCAMANSKEDGYFFIGVADNLQDAEKISQLDTIDSQQVGERYVVGVDREYKILNKTLDDYQMLITSKLRNSNLSEQLKAAIKIDIVDYKGLSVVRLKVPKQNAISFYNDKVYRREGSSTAEANPQQTVSITQLFNT